MEAIKNSKPLTPEQKAKMQEVSKKMKETAYEEHRAVRKIMDEENGHM